MTYSTVAHIEPFPRPCSFTVSNTMPRICQNTSKERFCSM
jgi:hypothetical protein